MTLFDLKPDVDTVVERLFVFAPFGFLFHKKLLRYQPQRGGMEACNCQLCEWRGKVFYR